MGKSKQKRSDRVLMSVIAAITIIEVVALLKGVNGFLLTIVVGALMGLVGLRVPTPKILQN